MGLAVLVVLVVAKTFFSAPSHDELHMDSRNTSTHPPSDAQSNSNRRVGKTAAADESPVTKIPDLTVSAESEISGSGLLTLEEAVAYINEPTDADRLWAAHRGIFFGTENGIYDQLAESDIQELADSGDIFAITRIASDKGHAWAIGSETEENATAAFERAAVFGSTPVFSTRIVNIQLKENLPAIKEGGWDSRNNGLPFRSKEGLIEGLSLGITLVRRGAVIQGRIDIEQIKHVNDVDRSTLIKACEASRRLMIDLEQKRIAAGLGPFNNEIAPGFVPIASRLEPVCPN